MDLQRLTYDLKIANNNKTDESWRNNEMASRDWLMSPGQDYDGPLKRYFNHHADGLLKLHLGVSMTIYDTSKILKEALPLAATPVNIQKEFAVISIWPYNREVFPVDYVLPSEVMNTENDLNVVKASPSNEVVENILEIRHSILSPQPSTSVSSGCSMDMPKCITPYKLKSFPKADSEESEQEDELCLVCLAPFSESKKENWIQCTACKRWAHVSCGSGDDFYLRINCQSDNYWPLANNCFQS
ncbi:hypothetical protein ILUMI_19301 [Ignelater luminosus]|uniref:Zinc finger PHD-type domain-containing protein n=1 Tax=Ignelater luminosus TaxID=2038154 RepID=A0A8K0G605_IGNLU|nr:hypothetical protein ILUMI_19301 [Ignelater luminosus]